MHPDRQIREERDYNRQPHEEILAPYKRNKPVNQGRNEVQLHKPIRKRPFSGLVSTIQHHKLWATIGERPWQTMGCTIPGIPVIGMYGGRGYCYHEEKEYEDEADSTGSECPV